ncbi:U-box domain-containing protein 52-like [Macadamia integrifolia]|uniref:U-box domain-containing protein 52-like n=1 Tax=Macadamia integrifolia TaxID=60698 RepID=UPI001C4E6EF2|nr:U-box domain-containing protein 52-like [Macadamia integrifolia]
MAEENSGSPEDRIYDRGSTMTTEIVEIEDNSKSATSSRDGGETKDVYVAVGKEDLDVLKWALDHAVAPGKRVFLVHVFPPIHYITTPVGRLTTSQLSQEQLRPYIQEQNARRRNLLQKYISLCSQVEVVVDTILIESEFTTKAILELIPVLNITSLVMGTKRLPSSRRLRRGLGKGEIVLKNAPNFCDVVIVWEGKKVVDRKQMIGLNPSSPASSSQRPETAKNAERNFFECGCFSGKSN